MNMSDQRHAKTVVPPLHLTQIEDPTVTAEYLGHRAALKASQCETACRILNRYCLVVNIYIYRFLHNYLIGSLLAIVFATLIFLICIYRHV